MRGQVIGVCLSEESHAGGIKGPRRYVWAMSSCRNILCQKLISRRTHSATGLVDVERYLLYEAIFLRLCRAYENLLEICF